jgi:CRP-like cAMP-binding protein/CheY-like chemotaxis protein
MVQIGKVLKNVPIFKMLGKESIDFIIERLKLKTFAQGDTVVRIGDPGDEMFIIMSGEVRICIYADDHSEQTVARLGAGDYFGEMALLTGETRSASAIANEECEMFILQKNDFDVILEKFPSISLSMGKIVSKRLRDILKKASQMPSARQLESAGGQGPSGNLKEIPLVDLISFAESNSMNSTLKIKHDGKTGIFKFETGVLVSVSLGEMKDDQALDTMLNWTEGEFGFEIKPLELQRSAPNSAVTDETRHLLIVNNSLVVRKVIERAFKGLGYEVTTTQNIAQSLDVIDTNKPDIIISDVKLADGHGLSFVDQVRLNKDIPFIFISDKSLKSEMESQLMARGKVQFTRTHEVSEIVKYVENYI